LSAEPAAPTKTVEERDRVVIRFAGDSGDGMQLTGDRFTNATAVLGNDLATLPDFPAEIRAPAGTVHGVSAFQIQFASTDVTTPGDHADVLVAMNPAALKADLDKVSKGGTLVINEDAFTQRNLEKAGYDHDPTTDGSLDSYQVFKVPMTSITIRAVEEIGISKKEAERAKNMFALGLLSWMYGRPTDVTLDWLKSKFGGKREIFEANASAFKAGYNFGETTEVFAHQVRVKAAPAIPGTYRNVAGAQTLAWGLVAAAQRGGMHLFYASYPITPASDLLHELSKLKNFDVLTVQAEDEIAAVNMALGASFTGQLAATGTSGPGLDLKADGLRRRPAGGSVDGHADEDGTERPPPGAVRASWRLAAPGGRGLHPRGLFRGSDGSRQGRREVSNAGDPALRQLPAEFVGAVAIARHRLPARDRARVRGVERYPIPPVLAR
jgi:2-oxoglutarate ferredoxin oxidoreductase subunit alpha